MPTSTAADFDAVVEMLADGIETGRGRRAAYLHRDRVHGVLRGRRGARLAALTSGGAIPETADYRVVADPDDTTVGTVNEDWAIESMAGDVFLLGSTSWRIRRVEAGVVRVVDAQGAPPSIPFWLGEAPARTAELSAAVGELREALDARLAEGGRGRGRRLARPPTPGSMARAATDVVRYLGAARGALGALPSQRQVIFERFFDETGGMQLVIHAPFGGRINRALGLALRKRFCRRFDFELQAAASDDAVVLSLGPGQSFPLEDVPQFLSPRDAADVLTQALLLSPMFQVRWRWNLGRALIVLRQRGGRRTPPPIQRMEADDLMAAVFPALAACQENTAAGPVEIPDHPIVHRRSTTASTRPPTWTGSSASSRASDPAGPDPVPRDDRAVAARPRDPERPPLHVPRRRPARGASHPGGGAPARTARRRRATWASSTRRRSRASEKRRAPIAAMSRSCTTSCWTWSSCGPSRRTPRGTGSWPRPVGQRGWRPLPGSSGSPPSSARAWRPSSRARRIEPDVRVPDGIPATADEEESAVLLVRGHLARLGPCTVATLVARTGLREARVVGALARLEAAGVVLRGRFDPAYAQGPADRPWNSASGGCSRGSIGTRTDRLRREIEPVTAQDLVRFLLRWQHVAPGTQLEGRRGLLAAIEQLQGFEVAAGSWEASVLPARVTDTARSGSTSSACPARSRGRGWPSAARRPTPETPTRPRGEAAWCPPRPRP